MLRHRGRGVCRSPSPTASHRQGRLRGRGGVVRAEGGRASRPVRKGSRSRPTSRSVTTERAGVTEPCVTCPPWTPLSVVVRSLAHIPTVSFGCLPGGVEWRDQKASDTYQGEPLARTVAGITIPTRPCSSAPVRLPGFVLPPAGSPEPLPSTTGRSGRPPSSSPARSPRSSVEERRRPTRAVPLIARGKAHAQRRAVAGGSQRSPRGPPARSSPS